MTHFFRQHPALRVRLFTATFFAAFVASAQTPPLEQAGPPATPAAPATAPAPATPTASTPVVPDPNAPPAAAVAPAPAPAPVTVDLDAPWRFPVCDDRDDAGASRGTAGCAGVWGLRGAVTRIQGARADDGVTLAFSSEGQEYGRKGIFSARSTHRLGIGGGAAGFDGALAGSFAGGVRIPVGERHGPVVRIAMQGWLLGNGAFYSSLFELPGVQLGYQYMSRRVLVEIAATTGVVLIGRYRGGEAYSRDLGHGFEVGAHASIQAPWVRLGASVMRFPTHDDVSGPVDMAEATLCVVASPIAICADGRALRGDAITSPGAPPSEVRSLYGGITAGFTREH